MTVLLSSANDRWYTPAPILDAARKALGGKFDLDPASDEYGNKNVQADRYYSEDGLNKDWTSQRLWLNPPSSRASGNKTEDWYWKLKAEYNEGRVASAIMLLFRVAPETRMFQDILKSGFPVCFPAKRIEFQAAPGTYAEGTRSQPTHGNALVYMGPRRGHFKWACKHLGECIRC